MNISELRERITIRQVKSEKTAHGYSIQTAVNEFSVWANVVAYNAQMSDGKVEVRNKVDYKITCRYRTDIHAKDIILYQNRKLSIVNEPIAVKGENKYIVFNAEELVESG
ncbi:MAG: phage head closure protein [Selenomonadaceae bacterium]|nr:phage head closure protein [Selenomonadaceae bacterium]